MSKKEKESVTKDQELEDLLNNTEHQEKIFRAMPDLVKKCIDNNLCIKMIQDENYGFGFLLKNFYDANGCLLLPKESGLFLAITVVKDDEGEDKKRIKVIHDWDELTRENHYHWVYSNKEDLKPEEGFLENMKKLELIEVEKTVVIYKTKIKYE